MAMLFFNSIVSENTLLLEQRPELSALREAGQKYADIERALVDLDFSGEKKNESERGLPFSYSGEENSLQLNQNFPLLPSTLPIYFSSLNGYRIFFEQQAKEDLTSGFEVDINTVQDSNWGGSSNQAAFLILPFCVQYILSPNQLSLEESVSSRCTIPFNPNHLRRIDLNIQILDLREDFNSLKCFDSPGHETNCSQELFNDANSDPYYSVSFSTSGCPKCNFSPKTVSLHHAPGSDFNIFLSCTAAACESEPFQLLLNQFLVASRDSNKSFQFRTSLQFDQNISSFQAQDINFSVRYPKYGIVRTNDPNQIG
jgi:hypothetical protein